ncbi:MAG: uracil-DNA glycosylase family protein [Planctomycetota bacterium]
MSEDAHLQRALAAALQRAAWRGQRTSPVTERRYPAETSPANATEAPSTAPDTPDPSPSGDSAPAPATASGATPASQRALAAACSDLASLRAAVAACQACPLAATRTQTVFADGSPTAEVLFVGEAPGAEEDASGVPFVGRAGQLLTDIITKGMRLRREDVAIANVLKCRPPENRDPTAEEKALCTPFLDRQVELIDPAVVIPLGRHAANHLLATDETLGRLRARVHAWRGRKVVPTYHPAYLLRSPSEKRACWEDIQLALGALAEPGDSGASS